MRFLCWSVTGSTSLLIIELSVFDKVSIFQFLYLCSFDNNDADQTENLLKQDYRLTDGRSMF